MAWSPSAATDAPRPLGRVLAPRSIAIVGASADPRAFGGFVLGNLQRFGWAGAVHLVSRSSDQINGLRCVKTVAELPEDIDLAVLAIPEAGVLDAVAALAARHCHGAVLFASGYGETGDDGRARQQALADAAGAMALIGPNCMGFTNFAHALPVTFEPLVAAPAHDLPGIAIVAQSGFMAATMRDALLGRGLPVTCAFSTGNEASVGVEDVLAAYLDDAQARVVAVYAEQIRRPALCLALARRARALGKPIVLLMPGRSQRAREAAASHTGALAGDHATARVALQREAVLVVGTLDELFDSAAVLLRHPRPPAGGTAFVTGSGAMKNIALDFADAAGLDLPALAPATVAALEARLPSFAVAENPLDYTTIGVRQPGLIGEILHTIAADDAIGSLVLAIPVGPEVAQRDKAEHIVPALATCPKPTLLVLTGDDSPLAPFFRDAIRASGVPLFRSVDRALRALRCVTGHGQALARAARADATSAAAPLPLPGPRLANGLYAEHLGKRWLANAGIPVPRGALARTADEAVAIAQGLGWPVVLKAQASALPHKSDVGGVAVGLADAPALRAAWDAMLSSLARHRPELTLDHGLDGLLVEAMGARGLELVVGARRDPAQTGWPPLLLVGLGGVWIEALKDVALLPADAAEPDIVAALKGLKAASLLAGSRGQPGVDLTAVAAVVARVGRAVLADPRIAEIDINPLVARADGVLALDALLVLGQTEDSTD